MHTLHTSNKTLQPAHITQHTQHCSLATAHCTLHAARCTQVSQYQVVTEKARANEVEVQVVMKRSNSQDSKITKKRMNIEKDAENVSKDALTTDYKVSLNKALVTVNQLRRSRNNVVLDMVKIQAQLVVGLAAPDNPFKQGIWDVSKNIFSEIIEFGVKYTEDLIMFLSNFFSREIDIDEDKLIKISSYYSMMVCSADPRTNSAFHKVLTVFLHKCGLNDIGLTFLNKIGVTQSPSSYSNIRTHLASVDEILVLKQATKAVPLIIFDNLDININILHHMTLPVLVWHTLPAVTLSRDDDLSHQETLELFKPSLLDMDSPQNSLYKEQLEEVTYTVLANQGCAHNPSLKWVAKHFPVHHQHPFKGTASNRTIVHIEPPIFENEMLLQKMVIILSRIQEAYLLYLSQCLDTEEEREKFQKAKSAVLSASCPKEELETAEELLKATAKKHGLLIVYGDQLSVKNALNAIRLRKSAFTIIERFWFILTVRLGDFHLHMNVIEKNIVAMMPSLEDSTDRMTLSFMKNFLMRKGITNKPQQIKKCGSFELHSQFFLTIGSEMMMDALTSFKTECDTESIYFEDTKHEAKRFLQMFLTEKKVELYYSMGRKKPEFFDDVCEYGNNMLTRTILCLVHKQALHEGDALCLHALHRVYCLFLYNTSRNRNSQYGPSLLRNIIEYERLSSADKHRVDMLITVNSTGNEGKNEAHDQYCEHCVRTMKQLLRSFNSMLEASLIEKAVKALNIEIVITDHCLNCTGMSSKKSGGGTSNKYIKNDEKAEVREEVEDLSPFSKDCGREKVNYKQKYRTCWNDLSDKTVRDIVEDQKRQYNLVKQPNYNS